MVDIDMEFRKGILFVRLYGNLSADNCYLLDDKLKNLIAGDNIRFMTFNVSGLKTIDLDGIDAIMKYNQALSRIEGKVLICGINNDFVRKQVHRSKVLSYIFEANDELGAINYINLGG